jgi:hypothetical protein
MENNPNGVVVVRCGLPHPEDDDIRCALDAHEDDQHAGIAFTGDIETSRIIRWKQDVSTQADLLLIKCSNDLCNNFVPVERLYAGAKRQSRRFCSNRCVNAQKTREYSSRKADKEREEALKR